MFVVDFWPEGAEDLLMATSTVQSNAECQEDVRDAQGAIRDGHICIKSANEDKGSCSVSIKLSHKCNINSVFVFMLWNSTLFPRCPKIDIINIEECFPKSLTFTCFHPPF